MRRIIRVFPRRTKATPDDALVAINRPPGLFDEADEVHVSVAFTWDLPLAEQLARWWRPVAPVKIGGPATGDGGGEFMPGMYLKHGYTITSRGCPNACWFCMVPRREGRTIRELQIVPGFNVLDSNLLACSEEHINDVFNMVKGQGCGRFTGGLEAARLKSWMAKRLVNLKPKSLFFAYDTPHDYEPLVEAGKMMFAAGITRTSHTLRCYVLCGYHTDTPEAANTRMEETARAGFMPMAMLYIDANATAPLIEWRRFQRAWARPHIVGSKMRDLVAVA